MKDKTKNETLWDMSDEDEIKGFIEKLQATTSNDQLMVAGLVLLLAEIAKQPHIVDVQDYCSNVINTLFTWTVDYNQDTRRYVESLKTRKISDFR